MVFSGAIKRLRGSVRSYLGVMDKAMEQKLDIAEELAFQATEQTDEYEENGDIASLQSAINLLQQAMDTVNEDQTMQISERDDSVSEFVHRLSHDHCLATRGLFFATGDVEYLDKCIVHIEQVAATAPESSRLQVLEFCFLSRTLSYRFFAREEKYERDAHDAVAAARRALASFQKGRKKMEFSSEDHATLEFAKELVDKPLEIAKGVYLYNRAANFKRRFFRYGDLDALRSARSHFAEALQLFPPTHSSYAKCAVNVADCEVHYVNRTNDVAGLESSLRVISSLDLSNPDPDEFVNATHTKSQLYRMRYDYSSDLKDLERSIIAAKQSAGPTTKSRNLRVLALENLSHQLCRRAETKRSSEDMDAAIEAARSALHACLEEGVQRAGVYATLGARLEMKYTLFGGPENLVAAIEPLRNAVIVLPKDHRKRALHLHNLSNGLRYVFEENGKLEVLDESIQVEREALRVVARDDPERCVMLHGLSLALEHRFRRTQNSEDLNEAISVSEEALAGTPKGSTRYPRRLHDLANVLHDRFMRTKELQDIDRAVTTISEAISSGSSDETGVLVYSMTLSTCLLSRHDVCGDVADIDLAITTVRGVVDACPQSHPKRPHWMSELSLLLDRRSECSSNLGEKARYLDQALSIREESVATLSENHPDMAWFLCSLGTLQVRQNELLPDAANQRRPNFLNAIESFRRGFDQANASPSSRIRNGMLAGSCYIALREWALASDMLSRSIQLFQQVSPLSLDENDRQHQLRGLTGMSTDACVSNIMLGNAEAAIEILEAGRGIIANIAMRQHDKLPALKDASPDLHTQYINLRQSLSLALSAERTQGLDLVAKRNQDQEKFQEIENKIRRLPGLGNFNKSLSASQIRQLAERGPLVSFCTTEERAFALVVTTESIMSLPLPDLLWDDAQRNIPLVTGGKRLSLRPPTKRPGANKKMRELLAWLWTVAVKPVLNFLDLLQTTKQHLQPRLWWVTSGPLGLMPLHAAGKGSRFPLENAYAHVVSSYTATFSALKFARECQSKVSKEPPKVALVTMPQTPARTDLATAEEAQAVHDAFSTSKTDEGEAGLIELCQPAAADVLHQVRGGGIDIFHLSCHAEPDLNDPSRTSLLFGSDATAPSPDPLPIQELRKFNGTADLSFRAPQLAYLSACCTAQQYELKLLDENIHLAAIFQVMGFPSVIGTLWEADDVAAAFIAKAFYQELFRLRQVGENDVAVGLKEELIARALHNATAACRLAKFKRTLGVDDVLLWANFVHFGP